MIKNVYGNIFDIEAELLVNAANGKGWMGGWIGRFIPLKGVAESIHYKDPSIESLAKKEARRLNVKCGEVFFTGSGILNFSKGILHAVTMLKPGKRSNIDIVEICLENILGYCKNNEIQTVAIPLLGTGTGKIPKDNIMQIYHEKLDPSSTCFFVVHFQKF